MSFRDLNPNQESQQFLAMLKTRMDAADHGGRRYTLAETREAVQKAARRTSQ
jgi:hypothetical protein